MVAYDGYIHRYLKNIDCSSFVMRLLHLKRAFLAFFAAATNSTIETNKAGGTCH
jgi:hypothetical protein